MITVGEALQLIDENSTGGVARSVPLHEAAGLILAEDLYALIDIPAYAQSSMDGYAFSFQGWDKNKPLRLFGEMAAGSNQSLSLDRGQAVRIFTGAAVPTGADTVVMQEKTRVADGELIITGEGIAAGDNVRPQGSEIKKGSLALNAGTLLSPAAIGFLAGMGFPEIPAYPKPSISIIVTGNELQIPGQPLQYGQVYEANSFSLTAALGQYNIHSPIRYHTGDNLDALSDLLNTALDQGDIVLITGGVSAGDYDFTRRAAEQCGVKSVFHKVKQRPGKPIYFGKKGDKPVYGLPGNPASVLTCFYIYVAPVIEKFSHFEPRVKKFTAVAADVVKKPAGITWFMKGNYENGVVKTLDAQESYRLSSFARANCLMHLEEDQTICNPGDPVTIHYLP